MITCSIQTSIESLESQISEIEKKIQEVEKNVKESRNDREVMLWYMKKEDKLRAELLLIKEQQLLRIKNEPGMYLNGH